MVKMGTIKEKSGKIADMIRGEECADKHHLSVALSFLMDSQDAFRTLSDTANRFPSDSSSQSYDYYLSLKVDGRDSAKLALNELNKIEKGSKSIELLKKELEEIIRMGITDAGLTEAMEKKQLNIYDRAKEIVANPLVNDKR